MFYTQSQEEQEEEEQQQQQQQEKRSYWQNSIYCLWNLSQFNQVAAMVGTEAGFFAP